MDSDEDLRSALESGCTFALVRVLGVSRDKAGTRSQTAAYECEVVRTLDDAKLASAMLKHFGVPRLQVGHLYVVGAFDSGRHHGAWEMRFAAAAAEDSEQTVAAFLSRRAALAGN